LHCDVDVDVDAGVYEITILGIFTTINSPFESILGLFNASVCLIYSISLGLFRAFSVF